MRGRGCRCARASPPRSHRAALSGRLAHASLALARALSLSLSLVPPPPRPRRPRAGVVVDEEFARSTPKFARLLADLAPASLGLNGTGGSAASSVLRALAPGAELVTYGCMSGQPVRAGTDVFTLRGITLSGASLHASLTAMPKAARDAAVRAAVDDVSGGEQARVRLLLAREPFADFPAALARAVRAGERTVVLLF